MQELFAEALPCAPETREALLREACAGDTALRAEVEALLTADAQAAGFLQRAVSEEAGSDPESPERIGPYRIAGELGRGDMGAVYLAERDDGEYRQRVALKLLRRDAGSGADVLRRFRKERQILAGFDHPNIARLLDGGTTPDGRPYFVLEAIDGVRIDEYCDRQRLGIPQRLTLFRTVCAAVAAAHARLIVHRDLKPGNILVTVGGVPKLLDFGIAKLLAPEPEDLPAEATLASVRLLTPGYASPEQLRGEPVGTASDVYSLGVLLHELLTGVKPRRREDGELVLPSDAAPSREMRRRLAGDLDAIMGTALAEEPGQRYGSVEQLADDVRRHLVALPVAARRATLKDRAGKFVRRHRMSLTAGVAFLTLGIAFLVTTLAQSSRLALERDKAEQALAFLVDLFEVSEPGQARGATVTAREVLDRGARRVDAELAGRPEVQATLLFSLGKVYRHLGEHDRAEPLLRRAVALRRQTLGAGHPEVAASLQELGDVLQHRSAYAEAESCYREALALRRKHFGEAHPAVAASLNGLADLLHDKGDFQAAEPLYRQALALRRSLFQPPHLDIAESLNDLALLLHDQGRLADADPLYREALAMRRALLGEDHPEVAISLENLAALLQARGRYAAAEPLFRHAVAIQRKVLGASPALAPSLMNVGMFLLDRGDATSAEPLLREALAIQAAAPAPDPALQATLQHDLGLALRYQGQNREAEELFRAAIAGYRQVLPPGHPYRAHPLVSLGEILLERGEGGAAEPLFAEALEIRRRGLPAGHWRTGEVAGLLGASRAALGRRSEGLALLEEACGTLRKVRGANDKRTLQTCELWDRVRQAS